jgi:hypothetical protein
MVIGPAALHPVGQGWAGGKVSHSHLPLIL